MVSYPSPSQPSVLSYPILSVSFPNFCSILFFFSFPIYYFILSFRSFYTIISFSFLTSTFQPSTPLFPSLSNLFCSSLLEYVSNIYTLVLNKYFTFYLFHVATNNGHIIQTFPQQSLDNILNILNPIHTPNPLMVVRGECGNIPDSRGGGVSLYLNKVESCYCRASIGKIKIARSGLG